MSEVDASLTATPEPEVTLTPVTPVTPAANAEGDKPGTPAKDANAEPPEGDKKADTQEQAEKRGQRRFERRLDKAYREKAEAVAKAEFLERQMRDQQQTRTPAPGSPRMEDFTDIQEYAKAYAKFESEQAIKEHDGKRAREAASQQQRNLVEGWEARAIKAERKYDDFDEVVGELKPTSPWAVAIMQADNGDDVAYYLGTHLKDAQRIASLDPVSQIREIGRLEAKLAAEPPKPKVSKAPAPIAPVSTTPQQASEPSDADDIGTWIKKRQKQVHGR